LRVGAEYELVFDETVLSENGRPFRNLNDNLVNDVPGIQFVTRGGLTGLANEDATAQAFAIAAMTPAPNTLFEPSDFASFRVELTHPIHPDWQKLGGKIELLDGEGNPVRADVFVQDRRITVDPCVADNAANCGLPGDKLTSDERYTLNIQSLPSVTGEHLSSKTEFKAIKTEPTVVQFQNVTDPGITEGSADLVLSKLNGQPVNGVILNSMLLGTTDASESNGGLYSELAYAPAFGADEPLPIRVPRGTRLIGSSIDVKANGTVSVLDADTGQSLRSGALNVITITDATGYLIPNPYTDDVEAPSHVRLFIDAQMKAFDNRAPDRDPPKLVSWSPGPDGKYEFMPDRDEMHRPGDPVTLFFDEPILASSVESGVTLKDGARKVPVKYWVDGASVNFNPEGGLQHGVRYALEINSNLTDLAGNGMPQQVLEFELPDLGQDVARVSPIVLTAYPGYPCVTTGQDLANNKHGQCIDKSSEDDGAPLGEVIPLSILPQDRPISVLFSQSLDETTVRLGDTFRVDSVNEDGTVLTENLPGRLEFSNQRIQFYPAEPWKVDGLYRYTIVSSQDGGCTSAICSEPVQDAVGLPVQTDLLVDPEDVGGPDLEIYFRGGPKTDSVFVPLRSVPVRDVNSNYVIDCESADNCLEPFNHKLDPRGADAPTPYRPSENATTILAGGNSKFLGVPSIPTRIGCAPSKSGDCPEDKILYKTYGLNIEFEGPIDPDVFGKEGVEVKVYPTIIATTGVSVFLSGVGEQNTGPAIVRIRHVPTEDNPQGHLVGLIDEGPDGGLRFTTTAPAHLDAPNLRLKLAGVDGTWLLDHDIYSKEFVLELSGPVRLVDDGRLLVTLETLKAVELSANVDFKNILEIFRGMVEIPLVIPALLAALGFSLSA
uniref:Ig-like domain-containing protein n=1 Tax=Marinobacter sp. TaxID=50741 RepID=UPI003A94DA25